MQENERRASEGLPPVVISKPSAYFYVEGTFYNDLRQPHAVDYSCAIREHNRWD